MNLTPQNAWQPFEPSDARPFDRRLAAHLYRRAGCAASRDELDVVVKLGPRAAVQQLLSAREEHADFARQMEMFAKRVLATNNADALSAWWLYRMLHTPSPLVEKLTLFWHGHFATSAAKVSDPQLMYAQNQLLRTHALGSFERLVQGIARDPAMLIYLDSVTNRKTHPNENFAREVMELFSLGIGNYTEQDIQELARCFTGWEIQRGEFKFNRYQHDSGMKRVLGESGDFNGDDGIRVLLEQPAAPRFICQKLVRFLVTDEPDLADELVEPLAEAFRQHDLNIGPLVETILTSNYFYSDMAVGRKIRSPVELSIGFLRALEATASTQRLVSELDGLGQKLFFPPNVKGWDGGTAWINSATLLGRANLIRELVSSGETRFAGGSLADFVDRQGWNTPDAIVDGWCELLLATPLAADVRGQLIVTLKQNKNRRQALAQTLHTLGALPEFQLG
jgi:uncharacterized protein (DUF1800 family)